MTETAPTSTDPSSAPPLPALEQHEIDHHAQTLARLTSTVSEVVVGQERMVERLVLGLLTGGHVLLEGVPGLAKTLTISTLAGALHASFSRIQFTPDLLPADLVGTLIYRDGEFTTRKGPVFANLVLADEINRAPAKVQSALLEAMQEKAVTIGDETHPLPRPFLVLATQNPIEQEGTYPLPEAQVDRFMLKLRVGYPSPDAERTIVARMASTAPKTTVEPVITLDEIAECRRLIDRVHIDPRIVEYIVTVVQTTREPAALAELSAGPSARRGKRKSAAAASGPSSDAARLDRLIEFGASPRASIALTLAGKANAFMNGRGFVTPSDIKDVALDVLRHRIIASYEAEAEGIDTDQIVTRVLDLVPIP